MQMALVEVKVPDIGDFKDVAVIELLVKPGDTVAVDQSLVTVESDKASMEIPSSAAGVVRELKVALGDKINEGAVLLLLEAAGEAAPAPAVPAAAMPAAAVSAAPSVASVPAAAPAPAAAAGPVEVRVPDIGDFKDVAVIEILVKPGDWVASDQSLITVESDKASMEIPSSAAGVVRELKVKLGDKINQGDLLALLEGAAGATISAAAPASAPAASTSIAAPVVAAVVAAPVAAPTAAPAAVAVAPVTAAPMPAHQPTATPARGLPYASPSVRRFARELGVPLEEVTGTGLKGRIT